MRNARLTQTATKILEVLAVRNLAKVDAIAPAIGEQEQVSQPEHMTRVVENAVTCQVIGIDATAHGCGQITELCLHLQTTIRQ